MFPSGVLDTTTAELKAGNYCCVLAGCQENECDWKEMSASQVLPKKWWDFFSNHTVLYLGIAKYRHLEMHAHNVFYFYLTYRIKSPYWYGVTLTRH